MPRRIHRYWCCGCAAACAPACGAYVARGVSVAAGARTGSGGVGSVGGAFAGDGADRGIGVLFDLPRRRAGPYSSGSAYCGRMGLPSAT